MRSLCRLVCVSLVLAGLSACGRGGAASWQGVPLGTQASFRSTWFVDAQHGFIGGGSFSVPGGLLGRTADGGKTWRFTSGLTTTAPDRRGIDLTALHFFDPLRGLAATGDGRILATDDGGDTWATVWEGRGGIDPIFDLSLVGDHDGWAAGVSGIVRTRDGGRTWLRLPIEPSQLVEPARAIHMVDREHGWLVGRRATLLATTDGGLTWRSIRVPLPASDDPRRLP